jgi:hypothetical protein
MAATVWNTDGTVAEIHTPQSYLKRVHEALHARHTTIEFKAKNYLEQGIYEAVAQIIEDCRIHLRHWPWQQKQTPQMIEQDALKVLRSELRMVRKSEKDKSEDATADNGFWPFTMRLRAQCVMYAINRYGKELGKIKKEFPSYREYSLANNIMELLRGNDAATAAQVLQNAFFEPQELKIQANDEDGEGNARNVHMVHGKDGETEAVYSKRFVAGSDSEGLGLPFMEIIELPCTEIIKDEAVGKRVGTSGMRIHRPALRKPVLPQRMFLRRARKDPGGTILIDASGSMGDFRNIKRWCEESPHATLAYYAGNDNQFGPKGQLFIYAREGLRCAHIIEPDCRGNSIDGLAIDWLMRQRGPRVMITDRMFCGSYDSEAQVLRLDHLERQGEIIVKNYNNPEGTT